VGLLFHVSLSSFPVCVLLCLSVYPQECFETFATGRNLSQLIIPSLHPDAGLGFPFESFFVGKGKAFPQRLIALIYKTRRRLEDRYAGAMRRQIERNFRVTNLHCAHSRRRVLLRECDK